MSKKGDKRKQLKTRSRGAPPSASRSALSEFEDMYSHRGGTFGGPSLFGEQRFALGGSVSDLSMLDRAAMSVRPRYSRAEKDWIAAREAEYADYNKSVDRYNKEVTDYQKLVDAYNESIKPYQAEYDQYMAAVDAHNKAVEAYRQSLFLNGEDARIYTKSTSRGGWSGNVVDPETGTVYRPGSYYATLGDDNATLIARQAPTNTVELTRQSYGKGGVRYIDPRTGAVVSTSLSPVFTKNTMIVGNKLYEFDPTPSEFTARPPGNPPPAFTGVEPTAPTNVPYTQEQVQQYVDAAKERASRMAGSRALGLKAASDPSQFGLSGFSVGLPFKDGGEVSNEDFIEQMTVGTLPEDAQSGTAEEAFRALVEGGQGYFGLDAARPGTEAYRTGQGLANLPVIGMPSAAVRAAGTVRGAASDALARFKQGRTNPNAMMATAYHGSGNLFGELDPSKAKSGVGEQRYGAGAGYAAESRPVAEGFIGAEAQALRVSGGMDPKLEFVYDLVSQKRPDSEILDLVAAKYGKGITFDEAFATLQKAKDLTRGYLYKGDIPDEVLPSFLDWNKSLAQQPDMVKKLLRKDPLVKESVDPKRWNEVSGGIIQKGEGTLNDLTGDSIYKYISLKLGSDQAATDYLNKLGVRGIRYADPGSKGLGRAPSGTSNFVVFNPSDYRIESVNDRPLQEMVKSKVVKKAEGGEVTNDEYIQEMMTGTRPTDQGSRPYDQTAVAQLADYLRAPVDLAQTAARGMVGSVVGPAYGVYKGLTSDKYGTAEGVREASQAGGELMQRITGEPKSQAARNVLEFLGEKAAEYKLAPMPQLMTLPVPGPGALRYPAEAAKTKAEDIALRAVRSQTENPDITAAQLYNAMLGKQAPGAAITKPMGPTTTPVQAPQTPLGFYSVVEDTVLKLPQERGTAQQLLAQISKAPGVKTKEVEATGLAEFLRSKGTAPVTKQEIQDFLANNRVQVDEVVLGKGQVLSPEANRRMAEAENRMIEIDEKLASHPFFDAPIPASAVSDVLELERNLLFFDLRGSVARKAAQGDPDALARMEQAGLPPDLKQMFLEFGEQKNEYQKYAKQSRRIEKPKFDRYNIPGGENAREIYLTLPPRPVAPTPFNKSPATMLFERDMMEKYGTDSFPSTYNRLSPDEVDRYDMLVREDRNTAKTESMLRDRQTNYTVPSSHSVSPEADTNRLAHIFLDDRTDAQGNKTLFVQELQSDWGQEGKKKGFAKTGRNWDDPEYKAARTRVMELENEFNRNNANPARQAEIRPLMEEARRIEQSFQSTGGPPAAPFVTNTEDWLNLALKRVIKEAVDSGADNVAFIKGEQAANKYSLSTVLDEIQVDLKGVKSNDPRSVYLKQKEGGIIPLYVNEKGVVETAGFIDAHRQFIGKPLSEVIGKEMAEKVLSAKQKPDQKGLISFGVKDMVVGGEGMKAFYDSIVPKTANKLLEKLGGGKIEPIEVYQAAPSRMPYEANAFLDWMKENYSGVDRADAARAWAMGMDNNQFVREFYEETKGGKYLGFKITPEMREIVKGQGLPQFAAGGEVTKFIQANA